MARVGVTNMACYMRGVTATHHQAAAVPGARQRRPPVVTDDLDGVGIGLSWPTIDDGVGGDVRIQGFLGFSSSFVPCEESRFHKRTKHIKRRFNSISDQVREGDIEIFKIHTDLNVADPLTKPLSRAKHDHVTPRM